MMMIWLFCSGFITDQQEYREHVEMSRKWETQFIIHLHPHSTLFTFSEPLFTISWHYWSLEYSILKCCMCVCLSRVPKAQSQKSGLRGLLVWYKVQRWVSFLRFIIAFIITMMTFIIAITIIITMVRFENYSSTKFKDDRFHLSQTSFAGPVVLGVGGKPHIIIKTMMILSW